MTVAQLIAILKKHNPNARVVLEHVSGYHMGSITGLDAKDIYATTYFKADTDMPYVEGKYEQGFGGQHRSDEQPSNPDIVVLAKIEQ